MSPDHHSNESNVALPTPGTQSEPSPVTSGTRRIRRALAAGAVVCASLAAAVGACAVAAWSTAAAAAYPERPIRLIVAFAAGGGSDLVVRLLVPHVEKHLGPGAQFVVDNRAGAGGGIGFAELARAAPDGYTLGLINTPNVLTIPIERKVNFSLDSFELLGNIVDDPGNFAVHASTPVKTLAELATRARAEPGSITVGTTGIGSDDHLAMLQFERAANVRMTHVPFKGAAEVRTAVQGQQIAVAAMNIGEALQYIKGGTPLRNLGVMATARSPLAPDLPTFREQGFDIVLASLRGMAAPKGLPGDVRSKLITAFERAINEPKFQADAAAAFAPLRYLAPDAYAAELREADATFRKLWAASPWVDK